VLTPTTVKTFMAAKRYAVAQGVGAVKLANLRPSHVDSYTAHLVRAGLAPRTVNLKAAKLMGISPRALSYYLDKHQRVDPSRRYELRSVE